MNTITPYTIQILERFHKHMFKKDAAKCGILWADLVKNPTGSLEATLGMITNPAIQTMPQAFELGFLLGATLLYANEKEPTKVLSFLNSLEFEEKIKNGIQKSNS